MKIIEIWNKLLKSYTFNIFAWLGIFDVIFWTIIIKELTFNTKEYETGSVVVLLFAYIVYVYLSVIAKAFVLIISFIIEKIKKCRISDCSILNNKYHLILLKILILTEILTDLPIPIVLLHSEIKHKIVIPIMHFLFG